MKDKIDDLREELRREMAVKDIVPFSKLQRKYNVSLGQLLQLRRQILDKKMSLRYNPYKMFVGSFLPNWLLEREEISSHAKLIFARLAQYAGKDGQVFPAQETIGKEVGLTLRTVQRGIEELRKHKLIECKRAGLGTSNSYYFLKHEWMASRLNGGTIHDTGGGNETTPVADKENQLRESVKEGKSLRSLPPTIEELKDFFKLEHSEQSEAEKMFYHYAANGWTQGRGKPIKDWKMAARGWIRRRAEFTPRMTQDASKDPNRGITKDSVWQGDLWLMCNDFNNGEEMEYERMRKRISKAGEGASQASVWNYIRENIPDPFEYNRFLKCFEPPVNGKEEA